MRLSTTIPLLPSLCFLSGCITLHLYHSTNTTPPRLPMWHAVAALLWHGGLPAVPFLCTFAFLHMLLSWLLPPPLCAPAPSIFTCFVAAAPPTHPLQLLADSTLNIPLPTYMWPVLLVDTALSSLFTSVIEHAHITMLHRCTGGMESGSGSLASDRPGLGAAEGLMASLPVFVPAQAPGAPRWHSLEMEFACGWPPSCAF